MKQTKRSVFRRGADDGLKMGPMLLLTVVLMGAAPFVSWLTIPALAAVVAVPVVAYILLYRGLDEDYPGTPFAGTWMHGICMFFCGGLLMALAVLVLLKWWQPDYFPRLFELSIDTLTKDAQMRNHPMIEQMQNMLDSGALPSAQDTAMELLYFVSFTGSLLSMLLAVIARRMHKNKKSE